MNCTTTNQHSQYKLRDYTAAMILKPILSSLPGRYDWKQRLPSRDVDSDCFGGVVEFA